MKTLILTALSSLLRFIGSSSTPSPRGAKSRVPIFRDELGAVKINLPQLRLNGVNHNKLNALIRSIWIL
jgi:hypothetical protein